MIRHSIADTVMIRADDVGCARGADFTRGIRDDSFGWTITMKVPGAGDVMPTSQGTHGANVVTTRRQVRACSVERL